MKNILIIGSTGQIGSELTAKLRKEYPNGNVVAGYIRGQRLTDELLESGPCALVDITEPQEIADAVKKYNIDSMESWCWWRLQHT
jgi:dTDP-4-dehydrorhamnose reductase